MIADYCTKKSPVPQPERKPEKCANRTCEVGMERATHAPYESFLYALEELTRA